LNISETIQDKAILIETHPSERRNFKWT